jgi:hypothetical protein
MARAARVEAFREEWNVDPEGLQRPPVDGAHYREWNASVGAVETTKRVAAPRREHLERGLALEL